MTYRSTPLPNEIASAVSANDPARVKELLSRGASLRWRSDQRLHGLRRYRADLLDVAFDDHAVDAARALLDAGMRLHPTQPGGRPNAFHAACAAADTDFIRLCVETRNCSALVPRIGKPAEGRTPLSELLVGKRPLSLVNPASRVAGWLLAELDEPLAALLAARPVTFRAADASEMLAAAMALGASPTWLEQKVLARGVGVDWSSLSTGEAAQGVCRRLSLDLPHARAWDWLHWLEARGLDFAALLDRQPEQVATALAPFVAQMQAHRLQDQPAPPSRRVRA